MSIECAGERSMPTRHSTRPPEAGRARPAPDPAAGQGGQGSPVVNTPSPTWTSVGRGHAGQGRAELSRWHPRVHAAIRCRRRSRRRHELRPRPLPSARVRRGKPRDAAAVVPLPCQIAQLAGRIHGHRRLLGPIRPGPGRGAGCTGPSQADNAGATAVTARPSAPWEDRHDYEGTK